MNKLSIVVEASDAKNAEVKFNFFEGDVTNFLIHSKKSMTIF